MKEIRITFRNEDFATVSQSLIDLGVVFQVEPLEGEAVADGRAVRSSGGASARPSKKAPKKVAKPAAISPGASALRAIAERNRSAGVNAPEPGAGIPEDLSAKLLPYSDRPQG